MRGAPLDARPRMMARTANRSPLGAASSQRSWRAEGPEGSHGFGGNVLVAASAGSLASVVGSPQGRLDRGFDFGARRFDLRLEAG